MSGFGMYTYEKLKMNYYANVMFIEYWIAQMQCT